MILHVLGNCGAYPSPGGACPGYLLENGNTRILLDLGSGTLTHLREICEVTDINAVICSHLHADHFSDLLVLNYALEFANAVPVPVYAPATPKEIFELLADNRFLDLQPIDEYKTLTIDNLNISFSEMAHGVQNFAIKIDDGQKNFMYTGDTALCDNLIHFAEGVHTMLCDCTFLEDVHSQKHLSLPQAVTVANDAGVRHLIMTHFDPDIRPQKYYQYANDRFKGRVSKAEILAKIAI